MSKSDEKSFADDLVEFEKICSKRLDDFIPSIFRKQVKILECTIVSEDKGD